MSHVRVRLLSAAELMFVLLPKEASFTILCKPINKEDSRPPVRDDGPQIVTEIELVERCRAGDREAQGELYARTSERIYRLLLRMTASPDDAFDLAQETYLRVFATIGQFDGRSSVTTWLYRVAVNEALQFLRRADKMRAKLQEVAIHQGTGSDGERNTVKMDVSAALAAIAPTDRAMLLLRYQEDLDYRAIAKVVGCAEGTVASRLNRARKRVREILQKEAAPREETGVGVHPTGVGGVTADSWGKGKKRGTRS